MKRLLLTTAVVLCTFSITFGQIAPPQTSADVQNTSIRQGNWIIGGGIGSTGYNFSTDVFNFNIFPQAAYFVSDNVAVGALVTLGLSAYDGGTNFNYGIAPLIRYYIPEGARSDSRWFLQGTAGIAGSHLKDNNADEPLSLVLGAAGGYTHFVATNVALESTLGYTYSKADISGNSGVSGLGLTLGLQIYLPSKATAVR
jgi:hypothetical protein